MSRKASLSMASPLRRSLEWNLLSTAMIAAAQSRTRRDTCQGAGIRVAMILIRGLEYGWIGQAGQCCQQQSMLASFDD